MTDQTFTITDADGDTITVSPLDDPDVRISTGGRCVHLTAPDAHRVADAIRRTAGPRGDQASDDLDAVYRERAHLVAHLTALYPAALVASAPDAPEWAVVYVNLPTGQVSWRIAVRDLPLFADIEVVAADSPRATWPGHSTDEKYRRLAEATQVMREASVEHGLIEAEAARITDPLLGEY